jgi:hypothetical protein
LEARVNPVTSVAARPRSFGPRSSATVAPGHIPWGFAELFVISQTALPALLYIPGTQGMRLSIRTSAFLISLAAFAWWLIQSERDTPLHRAHPWVLSVMLVLALMLFHPTTNSLYGGLAHAMLYFAVIAPFFWAPGFVRSPEHLARLLGLLLICSGVNSVVGVLQVYDPARFMPQELSYVMAQTSVGFGPVTYVGPGGQLIIRPPGLFDTPGAVAGPGMFAALLGVVFGLSAIAPWKRLASFGFAAAGIAAIYLTQVRISFVMTVLMFAAYAVLLLRQGRTTKAATVGALAGVLGAISFAIALSLGGQTITDRFLTLLAGDPISVYYNARGAQLSFSLFELLFEYPFGAGLARWGMAAGYFGGSALAGIWAELQITGWIIDGGIPLVVLYCGALTATAAAQYRLALLTQYPRVAACATVVFAAGLGPIALIFSFTPFVTQIGIQYWFLAGALHGVASRARLDAA